MMRAELQRVENMELPGPQTAHLTHKSRLASVNLRESSAPTYLREMAQHHLVLELLVFVLINPPGLRLMMLMGWLLYGHFGGGGGSVFDRLVIVVLSSKTSEVTGKTVLIRRSENWVGKQPCCFDKILME